MKTLSTILRYTKTVKLDVVLSNDCVLEEVQVSGDFFVYPEEALEVLENSLRGCRDQACIENAFSAINKATILGFDPVDLKNRILELLIQCRAGSTD